MTSYQLIGRSSCQKEHDEISERRCHHCCRLRITVKQIRNATVSDNVQSINYNLQLSCTQAPRCCCRPSQLCLRWAWQHRAATGRYSQPPQRECPAFHQELFMDVEAWRGRPSSGTQPGRCIVSSLNHPFMSEQTTATGCAPLNSWWLSSSQRIRQKFDAEQIFLLDNLLTLTVVLYEVNNSSERYKQTWRWLDNQKTASAATNNSW